MHNRHLELGDTTPPPTAKDVIEYKRLSAVVGIAKLVVRASVVLVLGWVGVAIAYVTHSSAVSSMIDVLNCVTPFWSAITGAVLGYLFSRDK